MKSFQEFAQEAFLDIAKQSASLILELCSPDNTVSTAINNLILKYCAYLETVQQSIKTSISTYDQELKTLQDRIDAFDNLPLDQKIKIVRDELKASKDIVENCIRSSTETIDVETKIIEEAKASERDGLQKEAQDLILKLAEMTVKSNTNLLKFYKEQNKSLIANSASDDVLKSIIEHKLQYLKGDYNHLLSNRTNAEKDLIAVTDTIEKLSKQKLKT